MLLFLSASKIYNTFSILIRSQKKKIMQLFYTLSGSCWQKSWHDVIMPERFQHIKHVQLCDPQPKKKKLDCCSMSFPVRPGRSPGMMLLCLSASKIYNTFNISILSRKKTLGCRSISFLLLPGRSPSLMLLCLSAPRIYNKSLFQHLDPQRKKKIRHFSISFLVHPGRSSGMMLLCLSASRINNTFSILTRSR